MKRRLDWQKIGAWLLAHPRASVKDAARRFKCADITIAVIARKLGIRKQKGWSL